MRSVLLGLILAALLCLSPTARCEAQFRGGIANADRIKPWSEDVRYWQYKGRPVLLLGGTKDDSLFQIPDLEEHLDLLAGVGGNYIRNTMSSRLDHGFEIHPFFRQEDGQYDLDRWNEEYWLRFRNMLRLTSERDIIVQIEVWDRFDYTDSGDFHNWIVSPYRPANNVNYTLQESGLADRYPTPPWRDKQPFFHSIPGMPLYKKPLDRVRHYQERFVEKMLSESLRYGNVLYCMNNETSTPPRWGQHWMALIRRQAKAAGVEVFATDMFDDGWEPSRSAKIRLELDHPELYDFIEISQVNSRSFGEEHWRRLSWVVEQVREHPRPINHTKIYGDGNTKWGSGLPPDGVERFWRNLLLGSASARFHRDGGGTGLQEISQASIAAARRVEFLVKFWDVEPRNDLLSERDENEAYLAADPGESYIVYFTDGGSIGLDLSKAPGEFALHWIRLADGDVAGVGQVEGGSVVSISAPGKGGYVAAIVK